MKKWCRRTQTIIKLELAPTHFITIVTTPSASQSLGTFPINGEGPTLDFAACPRLGFRREPREYLMRQVFTRFLLKERTHITIKSIKNGEATTCCALPYSRNVKGKKGLPCLIRTDHDIRSTRNSLPYSGRWATAQGRDRGVRMNSGRDRCSNLRTGNPKDVAYPLLCTLSYWDASQQCMRLIANRGERMRIL